MDKRRSLGALVAAYVLVLCGSAAAQEAAPAATDAPVVASGRFANLPAREVAARLSRATGALVLADASVASAPVTLDLSAPTPLPVVLARVAAALPAGATAKTVYLPASALSDEGRPGASGPDADRVAALAAAQEALVPERERAAGQGVVIQGKLLSRDQAAPIIAALDLKPVYLLTRAAADDPVAKLSAAQADALKTWLSLTPEQQKAAADQQINQILNMDPALRQQLFSQQREVMQNMFQRIQQMPEDQRRQFMQELMGAFRPGGQDPPQPQQ